MSRPQSLALAVLVAALTLAISSVALAAPPRGTTSAKAGPAYAKALRHKRPKSFSGVPVKAKPLLTRLLKAAAAVTSDDQKAAALSERYDTECYKATQARLEVAELDRQVVVADSELAGASTRLRRAAVVAYVSGELMDVNAGVLSDDESQGQMAQVYSGIALSQLHHAVAMYTTAAEAVHESRMAAVEDAGQIAVSLAKIAALRARARSLIATAAKKYASISHKLRRLVGRKEFERLFLPSPTGSPYMGPDLAGTIATRVATPAAGLRAARTALEFLGVPYVFGGAGKAGVDCSGLTMLAWASAGYSIVHSATLQWEESTPVSLDDLQPGDLLFYHFANDGSGAISHVVMYLGSGPYGVETVIQAAEPGTNVSLTKIYFDGLVSAGRP